MRMTPLPGAWGRSELVFWRLNTAVHGPTWDSGEGARIDGGRWNSVGVPAVYCSIDPATAIVEMAVHKTFEVLDTVPHVLTCARVDDPSLVHIVQPHDVPNPNWLVPGTPSAGQQSFGDGLLTTHPFVLIPSAVSRSSWNVIVSPSEAAGKYQLLEQEPFALDSRVHPSYTRSGGVTNR